MARKPGRMAPLGNETFEQTNKELASRELELLLQTSTNLADLRPQVSDPELLDSLIAIVEKSTANNENIAQLKSRLEALGTEGFKLAKKVVSLIS